MKSFNVTIKGITPLLMHRFAIEGADNSVKKSTGTQTGSTVDEKRELCKNSLYISDGKIYQPAVHIERALMEAGKQFKIKGKGKSTFSKILGSICVVKPDAIIHKIQDWVVDEQAVVIPSTKSRVIQQRPRFDKWELDFTIEIHVDDIPEEVIKEILNYAGLYNGLGDFRPAKKGKYGKFIVTSFKQIE